MVTVISVRRWGEPTLARPSVIKKEGFEKLESITFSKAKCQVYKKDDCLMIKHRDWFSPSVSIPTAVRLGIIEKRRSKFVYNDNFGSVVLRNEAWIEVKDVMKLHSLEATKIKLIIEIAEAWGVDKWDLLSSYDWNYFAEQIIKNYCFIKNSVLQFKY